jgi:hypothetical protein
MPRLSSSARHDPLRRPPSCTRRAAGTSGDAPNGRDPPPRAAGGFRQALGDLFVKLDSMTGLEFARSRLFRSSSGDEDSIARAGGPDRRLMDLMVDEHAHSVPQEQPFRFEDVQCYACRAALERSFILTSCSCVGATRHRSPTQTTQH